MNSWGLLRVNDVCYTVAEDDVGQDDLRVVHVNCSIGADTQGQIVAVHGLDGRVGDVAGEHDGACDGVVGQYTGESLDAGIGEGRCCGAEGSVVGDEDGEIFDSVDCLYEVGGGESTKGGGQLLVGDTR